MSESPPPKPFYLIVADQSLGICSVEGPMTDDAPWLAAAEDARKRGRQVVCGPRGTDRDAVAAECRRIYRLAEVPAGSILRPANTADS